MLPQFCLCGDVLSREMRLVYRCSPQLAVRGPGLGDGIILTYFVAAGLRAVDTPLQQLGASLGDLSAVRRLPQAAPGRILSC